MLTNGTKTQSHRAWQDDLGMSFPRNNPSATLWTPTPPEPTLTAADAIEFWKVGSTLFGAYVGLSDVA